MWTSPSNNQSIWNLRNRNKFPTQLPQHFLHWIYYWSVFILLVQPSYLYMVLQSNNGKHISLLCYISYFSNKLNQPSNSVVCLGVCMWGKAYVGWSSDIQNDPLDQTTQMLFHDFLREPNFSLGEATAMAICGNQLFSGGKALITPPFHSLHPLMLRATQVTVWLAHCNLHSHPFCLLVRWRCRRKQGRGQCQPTAGGRSPWPFAWGRGGCWGFSWQEWGCLAHPSAVWPSLQLVTAPGGEGTNQQPFMTSELLNKLL